tara:strand:- start:688 stop:1467 length:780 start_codon:yes stop_codon:yes gene_type:complete
MSKKVAPRIQLNFAPQGASSAEDEEILPDEELESPQEQDLPCDMPEVIERDEIVENDIFDVKLSKPNQQTDIVIEEAQAEQTQPKTPCSSEPSPKPKQVKHTRKQPKVISDKPQKKKRQLSEEHKAKLALAREKALVTRRAKAEEKKKMKEIENKTKELKKKKAQKDLEQLEDEVINDKSHTNSKPTIVQQGPMFTKEDLENAQLDAIMKYEAIRKTRKEEKRKVQMIEQQKKDLQKKIQGYGARDANGRLVNKWDRCY